MIDIRKKMKLILTEAFEDKNQVPTSELRKIIAFKCNYGMNYHITRMLHSLRDLGFIKAINMQVIEITNEGRDFIK